MEEKYGFYVETEHGKAKTVVNYTDGLPDEEIRRRMDDYKRTSNRLYRQMVRRKQQEQEMRKPGEPDGLLGQNTGKGAAQ